jgi:hypothetical protein
LPEIATFSLAKLQKRHDVEPELRGENRQSFVLFAMVDVSDLARGSPAVSPGAATMTEADKIAAAIRALEAIATRSADSKSQLQRRALDALRVIK